MQIQVDHTSGVPIYAQIIEQVRHLVATRKLKPQEQLPTIRQLAVDLTVDPNTVARAYHELNREGVISTQQGRGTFIASQPNREQLQEVRRERLRSIVRGALLEALSLGYGEEEIRGTFEAQLEAWQRNRKGRK